MKTKEEFRREGMQNAQRVIKGERQVIPHPVGGWQGAAYAEGFDDEMKRHHAAVLRQPVDRNAFLVGAGLQAWPSGAAEHARMLADDIAEGKGGPARTTRLLRALGRLQQRHGRPT